MCEYSLEQKLNFFIDQNFQKFSETLKKVIVFELKKITHLSNIEVLDDSIEISIDYNGYLHQSKILFTPEKPLEHLNKFIEQYREVLKIISGNWDESYHINVVKRIFPTAGKIYVYSPNIQGSLCMRHYWIKSNNKGVMLWIWSNTKKDEHIQITSKTQLLKLILDNVEIKQGIVFKGFANIIPEGLLEKNIPDVCEELFGRYPSEKNSIEFCEYTYKYGGITRRSFPIFPLTRIPFHIAKHYASNVETIFYLETFAQPKNSSFSYFYDSRWYEGRSDVDGRTRNKQRDLEDGTINVDKYVQKYISKKYVEFANLVKTDKLDDIENYVKFFNLVRK